MAQFQDRQGWFGRIAVSAAVFALALLVGARTHWVAVSASMPATPDDRAYAAVVLGQTGPDATSAELIDAAVSRGEISPDYGLLFGIYLACDPGLLPAEYRGHDTAPAQPDVLWEADVDWAALSPEVRGALRTFFAANVSGGGSSPCAGDIRRLVGAPEVWWAAALRSAPDTGDAVSYTASAR